MNGYFVKIASFVSALLLAGTFALATDMNMPSKPAMPSASGVTDAAKAKAGLLDINSASESELKAVPGVGDTYAKKIIAGRPYTKKDQLKTKKIIPAGLYDKIKDKIVARQPKK